MEHIKAESRQKLLQILKEVVWKPSLCQCDKLISGVFHVDKVDVIGIHHTIVSASLMEKPMNTMSYFMGYDLQRKNCQHPGITKVDIHFTASQWEAVVCSNPNIVIYHAEFVDGKVLCSDRFTPVLPFSDDPHPIEGEDIGVGELFTGGFSGWTQVIQRLSKKAVPIRHLWGLDHNSVATNAYLKSYGDHVVFREGEQGWKCLSAISDIERNPPMFFQCGIEEAWWMTFVASEWVPIICASPPCPPWSLADLAPGFNRDDGLVFALLVVALAILRPRIAIIENVSGMKSHSQWEVIVHLFAWAGFKMKWVAVLDLAEVIPQRRERLILIVVDQRVDDLESHDCQSWPTSCVPSLRSYQAILKHDAEWDQLTKLTKEELQLYMSPGSLPKGTPGNNGIKKQKMDVSKYRLRTIDDVAGTFMTSYGFAKQLDEALIQRGGIFGTLYSQGNVVRKFSVLEIAILQGVCEPVWLPYDAKEATFLLGNAIAVPHAAIGLLNGVMLILPEALDFDLGAGFAQVCMPHIDSSNIKVIPDGPGFIIDYNRDDEIEQTQPIRELTKLTISSEVDTYHVMVEVGINIPELLQFLNGKSLPARIFVCNGNYPDVSFPLSETAKVTFAPLDITVNVPSVLMIPPEALNVFDGTRPWIVILHTNGIFVVRVPPQPVVGDVYDAIHLIDGFDDTAVMLVDVMGQRLLKDDLVAGCIFAISHDLKSSPSEVFLDQVVATSSEMSITFVGTSDHLRQW